MKEFVVATTLYATGEVLDVYGPFTREEANRVSMALPASSTRDHTVHALKPMPVFDFSDRSGKRGKL